MHLTPIVNVDQKMPQKMLHTLGLLEAVKVVQGVERVTEEEVRSFLAEKHGPAFAATFKPEFLISTPSS